MTLPQIASVQTYGGPFVDALPQEDPQSEVASASFNQVLNDTSAMTATSPRVILQFTGNATLPVLSSTATWTSGYDSVWGNSIVVAPVFLRNSIGNVSITFPAVVNDQLGNPHPVTLRFGKACLCSGTLNPSFIVSTTSANVVNVLMKDAGSLSDMVGLLIAVEIF